MKKNLHDGGWNVERQQTAIGNRRNRAKGQRRGTNHERGGGGGKNDCQNGVEIKSSGNQNHNEGRKKILQQVRSGKGDHRGKCQGAVVKKKQTKRRRKKKKKKEGSAQDRPSNRGGGRVVAQVTGGVTTGAQRARVARIARNGQKDHTCFAKGNGVRIMIGKQEGGIWGEEFAGERRA